MKIQRFPQGTRVRVRRGDYPIAADLEGREGTVVSLHRTRGSRYNVQLSDEEGLLAFDESELEVVTARAALEEAGAHQGGGGSDSPG
jgi:hypothetical protein